jgi:hypothetical protein
MHKKLSIFILILLATVISSCGGNPSATATSELVEIPTSLSPTELPQSTDIPPASRVLVSSGGGLGDVETQHIFSNVESLATTSGLSVEYIPVPTPELLTSDVLIVVVLPPDPGFSDLAARYPEIRFISVAVPGVQPAANVFSVGAEGAHPEWIGFIAGYIAAILTNEWRVGALTQSGSNDGLLAGDAFRNGAMFFCGLCNPTFPPFTDYPIFVEIPIAASQSEWQPIADAFILSGVKTAYIYPTVADPEVMAYLAQGGMRLIGSQTPPDVLRPAWIATINSDFTGGLQQVWGDAISGGIGRAVPVGINLSDVDTNALGEGKLRLVKELISTLMAGGISPNTVQ